MIKLLDETYIEILKKVLFTLLPIIVIILIITLFRILNNYFRYGKKTFSVFKKKKDISISEEILELYVKKLNCYYKLIKLNNIHILFLECGIYAIYSLNYQGIITGNIDEPYLIYKEKTDNEEKIPNPIYNLKKEIKKLENKSNQKIQGYVLIKYGCLFNIPNKTDIETVSLNSFYYHFSNIKKNKIYTTEQIDEIYKQLANFN